MVDVFRCPPDHGHARNTTCYLTHRCRCFHCRLDNARRTSQYARPTDLPYSLQPQPVAAHVAHLRAFGYTYRQMAIAAGVNDGTPYKLAHGRLKFVHGRVGRALLAVKPNIDDLDLCTIIPARGLQRRVQALATVGWSFAAIARHTGMTRERLSQSYGNANVTVRTHRRIAAAYEQLWDAVPPAEDRWDERTILRTKNRAARMGWSPPLAWDDIDNDPEPQQPEPTDEIDVVAVELAVTEGTRVPLSRKERRAAVQQLNEQRRLADKVIASMLGVNEKTVYFDRKALGLPAAVGHDGHPLPRKAAA